MNQVTITTRIQNKHDIESNWLQLENFIPLNGELIIYDEDENHQGKRLKIGDGKTLLQNLPFFIWDFKVAAATLLQEHEGRITALQNEVNSQLYTKDLIHEDNNELLSDILNTYILNIDYTNLLSFDTSEIIFNNGGANSGTETTAILGSGKLGYLILGKN